MKTEQLREATVLRRAIRFISVDAAALFDSCKGADGQGFVCGPNTCTNGPEKCERAHAAMVKTAKDLRAMVKARAK